MALSEEEGIEKAFTAANPVFKAAARGKILSLPAGTYFDISEVTDWLETVQIKTKDNRAMGGVTRMLAKDREIMKAPPCSSCGQEIRSTTAREKAHHRAVQVWIRL